jgi:hypothetical protein
MSVRILTRADAVAFRELRLRALKEHADAFTSSYEEDVQKPLAATEQRIDGGDGSTFWGAFVDGRLLGIVGLTREPRRKNAHKADIVAMYVAPESKRGGPRTIGAVGDAQQSCRRRTLSHHRLRDVRRGTARHQGRRRIFRQRTHDPFPLRSFH